MTIDKIAQKVFEISVKRPCGPYDRAGRAYFENKESWTDRLWRFPQRSDLPSGWDPRRLCNYVYDNRDKFTIPAC